MLTQIDAVKQRNEELKNRAERDAIVHEAVQGEDPAVLNENGKRNYKDKAAISTTDDCI